MDRGKRMLSLPYDIENQKFTHGAGSQAMTFDYSSSMDIFWKIGSRS